MDGCPHKDCFAPDTNCALGHMNLANCSEWKGVAMPDTPSHAVAGDNIRLPWTGNALGASDLSFITGRAKPMIVGIAGPESAGKTTLLAAWYLLLGRGLLTATDWRFGGSFTLAGWEAVAAALRWAPGQPPRFPPHTASRGARAPGLLHLALRRAEGGLRDFLFADAPGEWYGQWAVDANAENAEGARWIARHADVLMLVADRQALSGPRMGVARSSFQLLTKRVAAERRGRPVALVWSKSDVEIAPAMESQIRAIVMTSMPDASEFSISVMPNDTGSNGQGFLELFQWVVAARRPAAVLPPAAATGNDPLFVFGRRS